MTAPQVYGYAHRGTVTGASELDGYWMVRCTAINPARPIGPYASTVPELGVGDRVLLTQIGTTRDDLVITGKLPAEPWDSHLPIGIDNVTGLQAALDGRATDAELAAAEATLTGLIGVEHATNVTQDGRLTTVEGRATTIEGVNTTQDGRLTTLEGRATTIEGVNTTQDGRLTAVEGVNTTQDGRLTTLETYGPVFQAAHEFDMYGDLFSPFPRIWTSNVRTPPVTTAFIWRTRARVSATVARVRVIVAVAGTGSGSYTGALYTASVAAGPYTLAASATNTLAGTGQQNFTFGAGVPVTAGTYVLLFLLRTGTYTVPPQLAALQNAVQNAAGLNPTVVWGTKGSVTTPPATITVTDGTWTAEAAPWWVAAAN